MSYFILLYCIIYIVLHLIADYSGWVQVCCMIGQILVSGPKTLQDASHFSEWCRTCNVTPKTLLSPSFIFFPCWKTHRFPPFSMVFHRGSVSGLVLSGPHDDLRSESCRSCSWRGDLLLSRYATWARFANGECMRMWDLATLCSNFKHISAEKLQGCWALRLVPCRFCTPCPHKRQDSQLHNVVIAVTMAYLISDALWILLQPDMVMPSSFWLRLDSRAGYSERVKREANRIPTCCEGCLCFLNVSSWGQNTKEHHRSPHRLALTCFACEVTVGQSCPFLRFLWLGTEHAQVTVVVIMDTLEFAPRQ